MHAFWICLALAKHFFNSAVIANSKVDYSFFNSILVAFSCRCLQAQGNFKNLYLAICDPCLSLTGLR